VSDLRQHVWSGLLAGVAAGLAYALVMADQGELRLFGILLGPLSLRTEIALQLLFAMGIGSVFALVFGRLVATPGSGLMWGVSYGLLWWIAGPLTFCSFLLDDPVGWSVERGRLAFPFLVGYLVNYGAVLGLAYSVLRGLLTGTLQFRLVRRTAVDYLRDMVIGGIAGFVGGLAFGAWMERVGVFPLIAGLVHSDSPDVGRFLHFIISVIIGATYGALFRHDIRGTGSSIAWGVAYGFIWWILGPLTIMPWWLGQGVQWSLEAGRATFPSLVGHLIYGVLLGLVYSVVDRLWRLLFSESDPLMREPEGPGTRSLRALGMGILASVAGGLAFTVVMVKTGALPVVARLIGHSSPTAGFLLHMVISAIIGATYGILFRREAYTFGAGMAWGFVYGLIWWFLGSLSLMPILLGAEVQWSLASAIGNYPSLIGHLAYGGTTALAYQLLVRRYDPTLRGSFRRVHADLQRSPGTPAPALWVVALTLGIVLPLLFTREVSVTQRSSNPCAVRSANPGSVEHR